MTFVVGAAYMADRPMAGGQSASKILYQNDVWISACCMLHVDGVAVLSELLWDSQKCMWLTAHINPTASRAFHTIRPVMIMPLMPPQKSPLARDINILAVLPEAVQASCGSGPRHQLVVPLYVVALQSDGSRASSVSVFSC